LEPVSPDAGTPAEDLLVRSHPDDLRVVTSGSFSLLTYNVHGLPPGITGDDTEARLRAISPRLGAFDVAALQEDFFFTELLMEAVEHPWVHQFHETLPGRATHSGLTLVSVLPLVEAHGESWAVCHGVLDSASDCLGSKGLQLARLELGPGASVDVCNLHMEAGGGEEDEAARSQQVEQLLAALAHRSAGRALIVVGDTNLRPSDEADLPLLERLRAAAELEDVCDTTACPEPDHIDRFLFRSGWEVVLRAESWTRQTNFVDDSGQALSDHPALSARFRWERLPE